MAALHPKDVSMRSVNMRSHLRLVTFKLVSALTVILPPVTQVCIGRRTFFSSNNLLWTMLQLLSRLLVFKISWVIPMLKVELG